MENENKHTICSVCLEKGEPERISGDRGHTKIKCFKCGVRLHLRCFGEANITLNKLENNEELFECEKCAYKECNSPCLICRNKEGYMQRLDSKKYVHTLCALFSDYFEILNFAKMKINLRISLPKFEKMLISNKNTKKCEYCGDASGILLDCECESEECVKKAHFYCAQKNKMEMLAIDADASNFWQLDLRLTSNYPENAEDLEIYPLINVRDEESHEEEQDILIEENEIKNTKEKNKNLKVRTKNSKIGLEKESLQLTIDSGKNFTFKNRGGNLKILCPSHRDKITYCLCRRTSGSEFMLCCDNCETWFHGRCVGQSNKEVNSLKKWYCSFCTDWINNRNNFLLKETGEEYYSELIQQAKGNSWKHSVIHNHVHYTVIDLILIARLFTRKAEILINNICSKSLLLKHIKTAYQIPFVLFTSVSQMKTKYEKFSTGKVEEEFKKIEELKNFDFAETSLVYTIEDEKANRFNSEEYEKMKKNVQILEKINKYRVEGVVDETVNTVELLIKKFKWGIDAVSVILSKELNLNEAKNLISAYTEIFSNSESSNSSGNINYNTYINQDNNLNNNLGTTLTTHKAFHNEIAILNQYISLYSAWQKNIKEMLNEHMKRKKESEKVCREIDSEISKDENSSNITSKINVISKIKDKLESNLRCKINQEEIERNIEIGRNLKINVGKELLSIENCLKEALDWDLEFDKFKTAKRSLSELNKLIKNFENILVSTDRMFEAVEILTNLHIFEAKADLFIKSQNNLTYNSIQEISAMVEKNREQFTQNSSDDNLTSKFNILVSLLEKVNLVKENVKFQLNHENDISNLKNFKETLEKDNKLYKKEIEKIEQKIFYLQNLENLLNVKNDLTSLENIEKLVSEYNISDSKFLKIIKEKKEKIMLIQESLSKYFGEIQIYPTEDECKIWLNEIKESNVILTKEEEFINNYLEIYKWYTDLQNEELHLDNLKEEELLQKINKIKHFSHLMKGELKNCYDKLYFFVWVGKVTKIIEKIQINSQNNEENSPEKLDLNEILILNDQTHLRNFNPSLFDKLNSELLNFSSKVSTFNDDFKNLLILTYSDSLQNLELSKKTLVKIEENLLHFKNLIKIDDKLEKLKEISILIQIAEKINAILETKNFEMEKRMDMEQIKSIIHECEGLIHKNNIKTNFKNVSSYQNLKNEIEKFDFWIEKYMQYQTLKRNNQVEKIDLGLIEVLIEESKKIITNLIVEVGILKKDLTNTKLLSENTKKLLEVSENFTNIDNILNNPEYLSQLKTVFIEVSSNQISLADKNIIDSIKSLEWATRARLLLLNKEPLNYRTAFRTSQEANSLKHFPEIKKKEYYTGLIQQVTLAKNIKDITELLKNHHSHSAILPKQISEDQFDKIVKEFLTNCIIELKEEKEIVENFINKKNENLRKFNSMTTVTNIMNNTNTQKTPLTEWEKFASDLKKFPIKMEKLLTNSENIINEGKILQKEVKKVLDQYKLGKITLTRDKCFNLYEKVKACQSTCSESDQFAKMYETSEENLTKLRNFIQNFKQPSNEFELYELISLFDNIEIHNYSEERSLKKELWLKKFEILIPNDSEMNSVTPTFDTIKNLYLEGKELSVVELETHNKQIKSLYNLMTKGQDFVKRINSTTSKEDLAKIKEDACKEGIDVTDQVVEQEVRLTMNKLSVNTNTTVTNINPCENMIGNKRSSDVSFVNVQKKRQYVEEEISSGNESENRSKKLVQKSQNLNNSNNVNSSNNVSIAATRSRRNISVKIDKDYFYDKDFIENFAEKITSQNKIERNENAENYAIIIDEIDNPTSNRQIGPKMKKPEKNLEKLEKEKNNNKIEQLEKVHEKSKPFPQFEKILLENSVFASDSDFISKSINELEEELTKTHPKQDAGYKKALDNILLTVKELEKYKKVSSLIIKGKLNLLKVAKFPYGAKYFEKLKKIEDGAIKSSKATKKPSEANLLDLMKDMEQLYSSIHKPEKKDRDSHTNNTSKLVINLSEELGLDEDDNQSLKSLSDREGIRFSPGGNTMQHLSVVDTSNDGNYYHNSNIMLTTKSSSVQSPSSPGPGILFYFNKESSTASMAKSPNFETFKGKLYDPFELHDEDAKENKEETSNLLSKSNSNLSRNTKLSLKKSLIISPIFYDPTKKQTTETEKQQINVEANKKPSHIPNSTLQIHKGDITVSKLISIKNTLMCTTNNSEEFTNIKVFPSNINITSKAKTKEVIPYIEKYLANKTRTVLTGWLELDNTNEVDAYNRLAEDYEKNDRSGFITLDGEKVYIFTLTPKYSKFFKKMKNEIKIFNKAVMNKIEKLIAFVIIKKVPEPNAVGDFIEPVVLSTNIKEKVKENKNKIDSTNENIITDDNTNKENLNKNNRPANMSPITSEDEGGEGEEENIKNEKEEKDNLVELLQSDNLELLEEYVNTQFANLAQEEIIEKLMSLDEDSRNKLLNLIISYQQRVAAEAEKNILENSNNESEDVEIIHNENNDNYQNNKDAQNDNEDSVQKQEMIVDNDFVSSSNFAAGVKVNQHLSYLGFSGVNTDLLKGEILKSQSQIQNQNQSQNIINEEQLRLINQSNNANNFNQMQTNMTNMNNMNQAYMLNMNQAYMMNQMRPPMIMHPNYNPYYDHNQQNNQLNNNNNQQNNNQPNKIPQNNVNYPYQQRKNTKFS